MNEQQLGQRLREARIAAGMSQQDVANRLGMYQSTIALMEDGKRAVKALELGRLARLYGMPFDELPALLGLTATSAPQGRAAAPVVQGISHTHHGLVGG